MKFTLEQIAAAHGKVKSGADFPRYVQDIKALGLSYYDFFVVDGHSEFVDIDGVSAQSPTRYPAITIASTSDAAALRETIRVHQAGQADFATFCQQAAQAGVQYWRTDALNLVCVYVDGAGQALVSEPIPDAGSY